jgi:hypothetical protein
VRDADRDFGSDKLAPLLERWTVARALQANFHHFEALVEACRPCASCLVDGGAYEPKLVEKQQRIFELGSGAKEALVIGASPTLLLLLLSNSELSITCVDSRGETPVRYLNRRFGERIRLCAKQAQLFPEFDRRFDLLLVADESLAPLRLARPGATILVAERRDFAVSHEALLGDVARRLAGTDLSERDVRIVAELAKSLGPGDAVQLRAGSCKLLVAALLADEILCGSDKKFFALGWPLASPNESSTVFTEIDDGARRRLSLFLSCMSTAIGALLSCSRRPSLLIMDTGASAEVVAMGAAEDVVKKLQEGGFLVLEDADFCNVARSSKSLQRLDFPSDRVCVWKKLS